MYISEFWIGVGFTILSELAILICVAVVSKKR